MQSFGSQRFPPTRGGFAAGAEASGHSDAGVEQGAGKGLPDDASELAGDNGTMLTLASFAAGCAQAAERSVQGQGHTGPPGIGVLEHDCRA